MHHVLGTGRQSEAVFHHLGVYHLLEGKGGEKVYHVSLVILSRSDFTSSDKSFKKMLFCWMENRDEKKKRKKIEMKGRCSMETGTH